MSDFLMLTEEEKRGLRTPLCRTPVSDLLQFAAQFLPTTLYPLTFSDASLFGMHPLSTVTMSTDSTLLRDNPVPTVGSLYRSADSESVGNRLVSNEVVDKQNDLVAQASQPSSVDRQPSSSTPNSDAVTANYPPMPATAQHVSEVQERILRGSSVNEDLCSPIQADTVDDGRSSESAVDPGMIVTRLAESTPDVFPDINDLQESLPDVGRRRAEKVVETPRSVTQRRSRIVARFVKHSECVPDSS